MKHDSQHADIEWRDDGQPLSRAFDDVYFSSASGLEETRYVFLQQNELSTRWKALTDGATFTIGETGFGTGLNFLASWALWDSTAPANARLHFISVEKYPLHPRDLQRALQLWPQLGEYAQQLRAQYPPLLATGVHRLQFDRVSLTLVIGEASAAFASLRQEQASFDRLVDAWFLDGFAPAKNPAMWSPELFENIAALSKPEATFATFTCAGLVKRGLKEVGFTLEKVAGFGRKREMLRGKLQTCSEPTVTTTPWHQPDSPPPGQGAATGLRVAIVGAGISGATVARALAARGCKVQVFEQGPTPGSGGSGNDQGILYAKLSPKPGPNGDFNLHALMYALRYYPSQCPSAFHACGLLQLAQGEKEQQLQQQIAARLAPHQAEALVRTVDADEASSLAGIKLEFPGLFFPDSGWLQPRSICAQLLHHENIELHCNTPVHSLQQSDSTWQINTAQGCFATDVAIVCSANGVRQFDQTAPLPLRPIRGQVSRARATEKTRALQTVLCGDGYLTPEDSGQQSFGATFKLKDAASELREQEHRENLATLAGLQEEIAREFEDQLLGGRAAVRAATPDYLPIVGPVPQWDTLEETYAGLRRNRKALIPARTRYQQGLFAFAGLGSRGFAYAPLAAEVLAAWVTGEVMPVSNDLLKALHPARFAVRALGRNRE